MKTVLLTAAFLLGFNAIDAQITTSKYLEQIRNNSAELTAFFSAMPKGGDLHHHYSGSIYAETYINRVVANNLYINKPANLVVSDTTDMPGRYVRISSLTNTNDPIIRNRYDSLAFYKQQLIQKWSVKDYNGVSYPSDLQFFETFNYFGVTSNDSLKAGLQELKNRAIKENVSYIETMFTSIPKIKDNPQKNYDNLLRSVQSEKNEDKTQQLLQELYSWLIDIGIKDRAAQYNANLAKLHTDAGMDDDHFTMRYQNYVSRTVSPSTVFKALAMAFESTNTSPLLVGVNIVAPENNETSMQDYWLHMQMYKFCHKLYPNVRYSMHAGELVLGMVQPEELTWHISEAVYTAGAKRIGHGVDIPYEANCYKLLRYMADSSIAVEINLVSNEFILKVKDDRHPITMYNDFGVPIVISTDDAGVLRTNLIEQYVLLAKRYPGINYADIKRFVFNSIKYSFIEQPEVKKKLLADLDQRFKNFETEIEKVANRKQKPE